MTKNAKMTDPGEMQIEKFDPGWETAELAIARKRMKNICATPDEVEQYQYNPNGARNNRHPGIAMPDYDEQGDDSVY